MYRVTIIQQLLRGYLLIRLIIFIPFKLIWTSILYFPYRWCDYNIFLILFSLYFLLNYWIILIIIIILHIIVIISILMIVILWQLYYLKWILWSYHFLFSLIIILFWNLLIYRAWSFWVWESEIISINNFRRKIIFLLIWGHISTWFGKNCIRVFILVN